MTGPQPPSAAPREPYYQDELVTLYGRRTAVPIASDATDADVAAAVLAAVTPQTPKWCGYDAALLWELLLNDSDEERHTRLTGLIGAAAEMAGAQEEASRHADQVEALRIELDELRARFDGLQELYGERTDVLSMERNRQRRRAEEAEDRIAAIGELCEGSDGIGFAWVHEIRRAAGLIDPTASVSPLCACGKPGSHLWADPDSPDWACRVPTT